MKIGIEKERKKWVIYRLLYCIGCYVFLLFINIVTKTFHPINLIILLVIVVVVFVVFIKQDNKIFKGIDEFNNGNYEYVISHQKEIIKNNFYSLEKLGGIVVIMSAYKTKKDDLFLQLLEKIKISSPKLYLYEAIKTYYHFMYSILIEDNNLTENLYGKLQELLPYCPKLQGLVDLLYKMHNNTIIIEELSKLEREINDDRMKNYIFSKKYL